MPDVIAKILPSSIRPFITPLLGVASLASGVNAAAGPGGLAAGVPSILSGGSSLLSGLSSGATDKLQLPQIPKFGGGAAPGFAPPPSVPDIPTSGGLSPSSTSSFTAPSASGTAPAGGGDFSAAIAQAISQILGQGGGQQQDAFSGQFGA